MADKKIKSKEEIEADVELEDLFSDIEGTLVVKLHRLEPEYAEGYCGKFNITAGKPLTAHQIKNRFGGKVFRMTARDSGGKYVKKKIISISGLPKEEGRIINPDGSLQPLEGGDQKTHWPVGAGFGNAQAWEALLNLPLSPAAKKVLAPHLLGIPLDDDDENRKGSTSTLDMLNMQIMMEFQQKMRESSLRQEKMTQEMQRDDYEWKRRMAEQDKPKDTLGGMHDMVKVFREMNGLKDEFSGTAQETAVNALINNGMPMIETMLAEFLKLKQMQMQMQIGQTTGQISGPPPELPARQSQSSQQSVRVVDDADPEQVALRMGAMYASLQESEKNRMMAAFMRGQQNVVSDAVNDTIDNDEDFLSDSDDREILENDAEDQQNENGDISDGKHARSAHDRDPSDRSGD